MASDQPRDIVHFDRFALDPDARQLTCDDAPVHLTPKAFNLLSLLIDEAPRVVPKAELHRHLWPDSFVSDATLLSLVKEVRRALGDTGEGALIRTAHRVGYAFAAPVRGGRRASTPVGRMGDGGIGVRATHRGREHDRSRRYMRRLRGSAWHLPPARPDHRVRTRRHARRSRQQERNGARRHTRDPTDPAA